MNAAKRRIVEPEPDLAGEPSSSIEPWAALTTQLRHRGKSHGLSREDAEDRAQDALVRVLKERPRRGAPTLEARAAQAHRLAEIDEFRRNGRQKEIPAEARVSLDADDLPEIPFSVDFDARFRLAELITAVQETVGHDAIKLLLEGEAGYTEAESAARSAPGSPTTGALRKRISRAAPEIAARIIHNLEGER